MKKPVAVIAGLAIAVAGVVLVLWLWVPRASSPDCSFSGWKRTIGVDLAVQVKDLSDLKTKIGISDEQVRDFDDLMKDYALKYDAACQDVRAVPPRMTQGEFTCLRGNMDRVLNEVRAFSQAVSAAKAVADATTQKEIVLRSLTSLQSAQAAGYRTNCTSAIGVDPKKISFLGVLPERSIFITNRGNSDFTFAVEDYPDGFDPKPTVGHVPRGTSASVALIRTLVPVPSSRPLTFHVRTNLNDDLKLEIEIDSENADLWKALGERASRRARDVGSVQGVPKVGDALHVITESLGDDTSIQEADKYLLASNVLFVQHSDSEARQALELASTKNAAILQQPSALMLRGLLANRDQKPNEALELFARARSAVPDVNVAAKSTYDLLSGTVLLNKGDEATANAKIAEYLKSGAAPNPSMPTFAARELCGIKTNLCADWLSRATNGFIIGAAR